MRTGEKYDSPCLGQSHYGSTARKGLPVLLSHATTLFWQHVEPTLSKADRKRFKSALSRFAEWKQDVYLDQFSPEIWREYCLYLARGDRIKEHAPMKRELIKQQECVCRALYKFALAQGWVGHSPFN